MNYYFDSSSEKAALLLSIRLKSIINTKKKPNQEIMKMRYVYSFVMGMKK